MINKTCFSCSAIARFPQVVSQQFTEVGPDRKTAVMMRADRLMHRGKNARAGRGADRSAGERVGVSNPCLRKFIYMRRCRVSIPVATQTTGAHIVGVDPNRN
jgi:hypothetical protein